MEQIRLLTPEETANMLGIQAQTLAAWRCKRRYPLRYVKLGRAIRYRREDVEAFIAASVRGDGNGAQK
ncbi:MAG: helix-turn-helix domain-containing protein [Desulfobulbus sp.]